ncbi:hypothetical protein [Butyrivibrio sp. WCE2006]|uniref:hypothetical protein n=1 Tax=Butyrivibrio sp. WCE2006 TaxID=1410611 RepID=UPI0005D1D640|nr:hypothetical protein [Butyrivibrio sp. WCE2006]
MNKSLRHLLFIILTSIVIGFIFLPITTKAFGETHRTKYKIVGKLKEGAYTHMKGVTKSKSSNVITETHYLYKLSVPKNCYVNFYGFNYDCNIYKVKKGKIVEGPLIEGIYGSIDSTDSRSIALPKGTYYLKATGKFPVSIKFKIVKYKSGKNTSIDKAKRLQKKKSEILIDNKKRWYKIELTKSQKIRIISQDLVTKEYFYSNGESNRHYLSDNTKITDSYFDYTTGWELLDSNKNHINVTQSYSNKYGTYGCESEVLSNGTYYVCYAGEDKYHMKAILWY